MADNETIADIIAWLRKPREGENAYLTLWRDEIADRLDAAWKRDTKELRAEIERLKEERNYSGVRERERLRANGFAIVPKEQLERGDCAKLRNTLEKIVELTTPCEGVSSIELQVQGEALTALAVPPRNCDRFATVDEAMEYHKRTNCAARRYCAYRDGCPTDGSCVVNWLLAKATEGGAK